jgi:hypothetical protein
MVGILRRAEALSFNALLLSGSTAYVDMTVGYSMGGAKATLLNTQRHRQ